MKKRKIIIILSMVFTIITAISISFAFFYYGKVGDDITLTSGDINISFAEGTNYFSQEVVFPKSDILGKIDSTYFDFTVSGSKGEERIKYEIQLIKDSTNTMEDKYIKVYITDQNDMPLMKPKLLSDLYLGYSNSERVVYSGHITELNETHDLRLRVWIDSSYTENTSKLISFKVNLYAKNDGIK